MKSVLWALGASLVVHTVVLLSFLSEPPPTPSTPQLVESKPIAFTRVSLATRYPAAAKRESGVSQKQHVHHTRSRTFPSADAIRSGDEEPSPEGESHRKIPSPPGGEGQGEGLTRNPPADIGDGAGTSEPAEVDVDARVHQRLVAMAGQCYPAAARRYQQRGTAQLSFCTDVRGSAVETRVSQSSGSALLDKAALGCVVERAAPFPVEAASRCFSVPIRFGPK